MHPLTCAFACSHTHTRVHTHIRTHTLTHASRYGPSIVDFRSGEILTASVLLGFSPFTREASSYSLDVSSATPYLEADHPDVLRNLLFTVIHEVGHTLGLRHNFIGPEDGNSSVMAYPDPMDTTCSSEGCYGGHLLTAPGKYDLYAIKYGYSLLAGEVRDARHPKLDILANGQPITDDTVSLVPMNPLFATDECIWMGCDPRVRRWGANLFDMGREKMRFALCRRKKLLALVQRGTLASHVYSRRVRSLLHAACSAVAASVELVGGVMLDATRQSSVPVGASWFGDMSASVVDLLVGDVYRLTTDEMSFLLNRPEPGSYARVPTDVLQIHASHADWLLPRLLSSLRLQRLEYQRAIDQKMGVGTYDIISAVAWGW